MQEILAGKSSHNSRPGYITLFFQREILCPNGSYEELSPPLACKHLNKVLNMCGCKASHCF